MAIPLFFLRHGAFFFGAGAYNPTISAVSEKKKGLATRDYYRVSCLMSVIDTEWKSKNVDNFIHTQLKAGIRTFYIIQKGVKSMQKQPSC